MGLLPLMVLSLMTAQPARAATTWAHEQEIVYSGNVGCGAYFGGFTDRMGVSVALTLGLNDSRCPRQTFSIGRPGGPYLAEQSPFANYPNRINLLGITEDSTGTWFLMQARSGLPSDFHHNAVISVFHRDTHGKYSAVKTIGVIPVNDCTGSFGCEGSIIASGGRWWAVYARRTSKGMQIVQARTLGGDGGSVVTRLLPTNQYVTQVQPQLLRSSAGKMAIVLNHESSWFTDEVVVSDYASGVWGPLHVVHRTTSQDDYQYLQDVTFAGANLVLLIQGNNRPYQGLATRIGSTWHWHLSSSSLPLDQVDATSDGHLLVAQPIGPSFDQERVLRLDGTRYVEVGRSTTSGWLTHTASGGAAYYNDKVNWDK